MELEIRDLQKKDYTKPIEFAIKGMNFDAYVNNKLQLKLYGRYFWYLELMNATKIIAAYMGDELAGVLLANIKGEKKVHNSILKRMYIKVFEFLQATFFSDGDFYDEANQKMLNEYKINNEPDGEIGFLAANPNVKVKGIGTMLVDELEKSMRGKEIYLFTDDKCTYKFYEHRGFSRYCEEDIIMNLGKKKVNLRCFLYNKIFSNE